MQYEIDWNRVVEILQERAAGDTQLRLHIESATWQAIAERMKSKLEGEPPTVAETLSTKGPQPQSETP